MKYILIKQEDFDRLSTSVIEDKGIKDYKFGFDANGLHFIYWKKLMDFFKENGIAYKVVEQ